MNIAFFGSSLVSAYWNGAATYYRGIIRNLHQRGHVVTFYEPDAYDRQKHRDLKQDPEYARVVVYNADTTDELKRHIEEAAKADLIIKANGIGVFDAFLEATLPSVTTSDALLAFWDVDAPATLDRMQNDPTDPLRNCIQACDLILTYGGGDPVINAYQALGARACVPIYNAMDPDTHHPTNPAPRFKADLSFLGNRLPDREARVDTFFIDVARALPDRQFLIGGNGWDSKDLPDNVTDLGHVYTADHNAFNCTPHAVLNINRESMARYGYSPATRVFEAAGAGACMITDAFEGVEAFFEPGREILVADTGDDVARHLEGLTPDRARAIGQAALKRALHEHTYAHRAVTLERVLDCARPAVPH